MAQSNIHSDGPLAVQPHEPRQAGFQEKAMSLKIYYTILDGDKQSNFLARWPHIMRIRTILLHDQTVIGALDLQTCLQAVAQSSPELAGDRDRDFAVYATDYAEVDRPLVGQGMFGLALHDTAPNGSSQQLVTGRVTNDPMALFRGGVGESLEVSLRLTTISMLARPTSTPAPAPTPPPAPPLSQTVALVAPVPVQAPTPNHSFNEPSFNHNNNTMNDMGYSLRASGSCPPVLPMMQPGSQQGQPSILAHDISRSSPAIKGSPHFPPAAPPIQPTQTQVRPQLINTSSQPFISGVQQIAPRPITAGSQNVSASSPAMGLPAKVSAKTGKPRGRPRKKPSTMEGNTSGYEDGTDGDDAPLPKKRVKITQGERNSHQPLPPFGSAHDSLRVTASTSGAIRHFRPLAPTHPADQSQNAGTGTAHEIPRAPTPIPVLQPAHLSHQTHGGSNLRRQSTSTTCDESGPGSFTAYKAPDNLSQNPYLGVESSGADSFAPSPAQTYSDDPSPADITSSPPMQKSTMYINLPNTNHSRIEPSPTPSSPLLPPMPTPAPPLLDSGFMSAGLEDNSCRAAEKNDQPNPDSRPQSQKEVEPANEMTNKSEPKPKRARPKRAAKPKKAAQQQQQKQPIQPQQSAPGENSLIIHNETPGPVELLPTTVLYTGPNPAKSCPPPDKQPMLPPDMPTPVFIKEEVTSSPQKSKGDSRNEDRLSVDPASFTPADSFVETPMPAESAESGTCELPPPPSASMEPVDEPELSPPMVPASDPVLPVASADSHPSRPATASATANPATDLPQHDSRCNKNFVKKQAIKQKLMDAITKGQLPPYCNNCGAIETPTWRKIWKKEDEKEPERPVEYSDKPGQITAINVIKRDENGQEILLYETVKKALGPGDDKTDWNEVLLCNPCGIWFSKWKVQRPSEKWEKDANRLNQTRRKRPNGAPHPRSKRARTKSDLQAHKQPQQQNPASELGLPTDPASSFSPKLESSDEFFGDKAGGDGSQQDVDHNRRTASTHSRGSARSGGSGTVASPIAIDDDMGGTRRLLFPSPRKTGERGGLLGEVDGNLVQVPLPPLGTAYTEKPANQHDEDQEENDDILELFGPPSTPPPENGTEPFKTPTTHRPITRSVTKSIRSSARQCLASGSPSRPQRTPTRTPLPRRTPRSSVNQTVHNFGPGLLSDAFPAESPFTKSVHQLLAEASDFIAPDFDLGSMDQDGFEGMGAGEGFDLAALLSTDAVGMPSSPPGLGVGVNVDVDVFGEGELWRGLDVDVSVGVGTGGGQVEGGNEA